MRGPNCSVHVEGVPRHVAPPRFPVLLAVLGSLNMRRRRRGMRGLIFLCRPVIFSDVSAIFIFIFKDTFLSWCRQVILYSAFIQPGASANPRFYLARYLSRYQKRYFLCFSPYSSLPTINGYLVCSIVGRDLILYALPPQSTVHTSSKCLISVALFALNIKTYFYLNFMQAFVTLSL